MRLIDADALIEGYKHMGYDPTENPEESYMEGWCKGFNSAIDHCMHHVIHAPTVEQPELHWVPCDEKLPGNDERVLICGVRGGIAIARKAIGNPVFGEYAFWVQGNKIMIADAWQRLPDPYVKEGVQ